MMWILDNQANISTTPLHVKWKVNAISDYFAVCDYRKAHIVEANENSLSMICELSKISN